MRALIVYESVCPRTCEVVGAIAADLTARGAAVDVVTAATAPPAFERPVDLLVVAAPTNPLPTQPAAAFIPTVGLPVPPGPAGAPGVPESGAVREWIERVDLPHGQPTATFDVRTRPGRPGSPARAAARRLRERGATIIGTQSFHVARPEGALPADEARQARAWAEGLVVGAAIHRVG